MNVLDVLAARPADRLTLTTIARTADINSATCLGILNELSLAGFVERHEDLGYTLGGALIAMGAAARQSRPGTAQASRELDALSTELGLVCTASAVVGGQIVVLDAAGPRTGEVPAVGPGSTFPFAAPVGLMFVAWAPDAEADAWLERAPVEIEAKKLRRLQRVIRSSRRHGFLVERLTNVETNLHEFLARAPGGLPEPAVGQALTMALSIFVDRDHDLDEIDRNTDASVSVITAPCFDAEGRPDVCLGVYVMRDQVPWSEIDATAERLQRSCARVTASRSGRNPWGDA